MHNFKESFSRPIVLPFSRLRPKYDGRIGWPERFGRCEASFWVLVSVKRARERKGERERERARRNDEAKTVDSSRQLVHVRFAKRDLDENHMAKLQKQTTEPASTELHSTALALERRKAKQHQPTVWDGRYGTRKDSSALTRLRWTDKRTTKILTQTVGSMNGWLGMIRASHKPWLLPFISARNLIINCDLTVRVKSCINKARSLCYGQEVSCIVASCFHIEDCIRQHPWLLFASQVLAYSYLKSTTYYQQTDKRMLQVAIHRCNAKISMRFCLHIPHSLTNREYMVSWNNGRSTVIHSNAIKSTELRK